MKKIAVAIFIIAMLAATVYAVNAYSPAAAAETDYLRIHVRANSNLQTDQNVKYKVKDEIVKFITPYIGECVDKESAIAVVNALIPQICEVCDRTLEANGYDYRSRAEVRSENFPTRVYGEHTLEQGVYDALIIELGSGAGDNWWCVIYPPLCFTSATADVEYRSVIADIINKFFNK